MEATATFFLKISVYKYRNNQGYVFARDIRVDSEPALLGRSLSVHELRHVLKKKEYRLQYERRSAGKLIYSIVKRKK